MVLTNQSQSDAKCVTEKKEKKKEKEWHQFKTGIVCYVGVKKIPF